VYKEMIYSDDDEKEGKEEESKNMWANLIKSI